MSGNTFLPDLRSIKAVIFDFDGVFTTNSVFVDLYGHELVECSRYDGYGLSMIASIGIKRLIISSETVPIVHARANKLGILAAAPVNDKLKKALEWLTSIQVDLSKTAFVGNDINDIELLSHVGYPFCPADAHHEVLKIAYKLKLPGGRGVVRELCDMIVSSSS